MIRKIFNILRIVVLWNLIIILLQCAAKVLLQTDYEFTVLTIPEEIVKSLVQKGTMWQFWYFGALIIIYVLLFFLTRMTGKQKRIFLFVSGVAAISFQVCSMITGTPVQMNVNQTFRMWTWLLYFIGGGLMYCYVNVRSQKYLCHRSISIALIAVTLAVAIYQNLIGRYIINESAGVLHAEYFYDSLLTMFWAFLLFAWVKTIKLNAKAKKWIGGSAPLTMGIYIIHPLIIRVYQHFITVDTIILSLIFFIAVLISAGIAAAAISKIPVVKYLIKL